MQIGITFFYLFYLLSNRGLLGGCYIHSKLDDLSGPAGPHSTLTHSSHSSSAASAAGGLHSQASTPDTGGGIGYSSSTTKNSSSGSNHCGGLADHVGKVISSINEENVIDWTVEAVSKRLASLARPTRVTLLDCSRPSLSIVDVVKDSRKVKFLYEYLMTVNENNEDLLGNSVVASVSILVNHYKEIEKALDKSFAEHRNFETASVQVIHSAPIESTINNALQTSGIYESIARELNESFIQKFLASPNAARMFGCLYKSPDYCYISASEVLSNKVFLLIYYFYLSSQNR